MFLAYKSISQRPKQFFHKLNETKRYFTFQTNLQNNYDSSKVLPESTSNHDSNSNEKCENLVNNNIPDKKDNFETDIRSIFSNVKDQR